MRRKNCESIVIGGDEGGKIIITQAHVSRLMESNVHERESKMMFNFLQNHLAAGTFDRFLDIATSYHEKRCRFRDMP
jgi:hypothetical protein